MKRENTRDSLLPIQNRLRQELAACKLERTYLSAQIGVSVKTISAYMHKNVFPALDTFAKLCVVLGVSADCILNGENAQPQFADCNTITMERIHENLCDAIRQSGIAHNTIAAAIGVSNRTISAYLHNGVFPALDTLARLCKVLDVSADGILGTSVL